MEKDIPQIAPTEILIKVKACGICGSDVHMAQSDEEGYIFYPGLTAFPCILGHEFSGIVAEAGKEAFNKRTGKRYEQGETAVVLGAGPMRLLFVQMFKASGAGKIIASEISEYRAKFAYDIGANRLEDPLREDLYKSGQRRDFPRSRCGSRYRRNFNERCNRHSTKRRTDSALRPKLSGKN